MSAQISRKVTKREETRMLAAFARKFQDFIVDVEAGKRRLGRWGVEGIGQEVLFVYAETVRVSEFGSGPHGIYEDGDGEPIWSLIVRHPRHDDDMDHWPYDEEWIFEGDRERALMVLSKIALTNFETNHASAPSR